MKVVELTNGYNDGSHFVNPAHVSAVSKSTVPSSFDASIFLTEISLYGCFIYVKEPAEEVLKKLGFNY